MEAEVEVVVLGMKVVGLEIEVVGLKIEVVILEMEVDIAGENGSNNVTKPPDGKGIPVL